MDLYQIIYSSRNCMAGTPEEVEREIQSILQASRKNNTLDGITGALLFNGHGFAQVLEGTLDAIEKTYERIQCDSRHSDVVLLSNGACGARTFSDWSMAYVDPASLLDSPNQLIDLDAICSNPSLGAVQVLESLRYLIAG